MAPCTCGIGPRGVAATRTSQPSRRGSICITPSCAPAAKYNLAQAGHTPERVHTVAKVDFGRDDKGPMITKIDLICEVKAPGLDQAKLQEIGDKAKAGCPISRALAAVPTITLAIKLV